MMRGRLFAAVTMLAACGARAMETCTYAGMTSYAGQASVQTEASTADSVLSLRVTARLDAEPSWFWSVRILAEEISTWRNGELQSVAVNNRYLANGEIKRQQWDVFVREGTGLAGRRVQAKTLADFRRRHPAFVQTWAVQRFGEPWLALYQAAQPERRADLDPVSPPAGLRTPLALAFYWSRFLPEGGVAIPVFLPGWKRDGQLALPVVPSGTGRWRVLLRHPALDPSPVSWAEAVVSPDHALRRIAFDVHAPAGSGTGWIDRVGCR